MENGAAITTTSGRKKKKKRDYVPLPPRMRVDVVLATIAGTAGALKDHFPELYLQAVEDEARKALSNWPISPMSKRQAVRYMSRVKKALEAIEPAFQQVHSLAALLLCWAGMAERLYIEARRTSRLDDLRDLLDDYIKNLDIDKAVPHAEKMLKHIEEVLEWK